MASQRGQEIFSMVSWDPPRCINEVLSLKLCWHISEKPPKNVFSLGHPAPARYINIGTQGLQIFGCRSDREPPLPYWDLSHVSEASGTVTRGWYTRTVMSSVILMLIFRNHLPVTKSSLFYQKLEEEELPFTLLFCFKHKHILKDLNLSFTLNLVFTTTHPPLSTQNFFLGF